MLITLIRGKNIIEFKNTWIEEVLKINDFIYKDKAADTGRFF